MCIILFRDKKLNHAQEYRLLHDKKIKLIEGFNNFRHFFL